MSRQDTCEYHPDHPMEGLCLVVTLKHYITLPLQKDHLGVDTVLAHLAEEYHQLYEAKVEQIKAIV